MNSLFEPVIFRNLPFAYGPTNRATDRYPGYYHWHQCCEMLYVHEGTGSVVVDRKTHEMRPGRLFFFQPFQLHKVFASVSEETPYVRTIVSFDPLAFDGALRPFPTLHGKFERLWRSRPSEGVLDLGQEQAYAESLFRRYDALLSGNPAAMNEEHATLLLLQLLEAIASRQADEDAGAVYRPYSYSEQAMKWIEDHYAEDFRLERLAEELHLSKFYLSRLFQRETGGSLSEYVLARRMKQACRLLETTSLSVERIADAVGYPNVSSFIRVFKKRLGETPLRYRAVNRPSR